MIQFAFQEDLIGKNVKDLLKRVRVTEVASGKDDCDRKQDSILRIGTSSRVKKK